MNKEQGKRVESSKKFSFRLFSLLVIVYILKDLKTVSKSFAKN